VALGKPTLALFLDSDPVKFGPQEKMHRMVQASDGEISVGTVKKTIQGMIRLTPIVQT
jgi:ADP-heptose:LPS heptosyltransferase